MNTPWWAWAGVLGVILAMLAIDLLAHRRAHVISVREAAAWSAFWLALGVGFGVLVWSVYGGEFGAQYFSGYVIEKSLAVDNVFVWAIIFSYLAVPREYQHRVLMLGVISALVLRGAFIAAGAVVLQSFGFVIYLFGAFLVLTGIQMLRTRNEHYDVANSRILRAFRSRVPHTDDYHGTKFVVRQAGRWVATPLLAVLLLIELTDVVFAVDSIPAIFAVTQEPFLVFTANAFAILGLRAMYFLLADLIGRFIYLKIGLAVVLVWVGVKMLLLIVDVKVPTLLSLGIVVAIIATSVIASLVRTRGGSAPDELGALQSGDEDPEGHADTDHEDRNSADSDAPVSQAAEEPLPVLSTGMQQRRRPEELRGQDGHTRDDQRQGERPGQDHQ